MAIVGEIDAKGAAAEEAADITGQWESAEKFFQLHKLNVAALTRE